MTAEGWIFTIQGDDTKYGVGATDAMILVVPDTWYADTGGGRALLARTAGAGLRAASEQGAARMGGRLHHADWQLTSSASTVLAVMPPGHCTECDAGTTAALAHLASHPGGEVALGLLYLAAEQAPS